MTINIKGFAATAVYFGIGLLVYLLLYAPDVFVWSNPWVYIVTVLWPFALLWEFLYILMWIVIIVIVVAGAMIIFDRLS